MATAVARAGDVDRAAKLIVRAEAIADTVLSNRSRPAARRIRRRLTRETAARTVALLAEAVVTIGDLERAGTLIEHAENIARANTNPFTQASMLVSVVEAMVKAGDLDRAEAIADSIVSRACR